MKYLLLIVYLVVAGCPEVKGPAQECIDACGKSGVSIFDNGVTGSQCICK
jgi:hypothetical protein